MSTFSLLRTVVSIIFGCAFLGVGCIIFSKLRAIVINSEFGILCSFIFSHRVTESTGDLMRKIFV